MVNAINNSYSPSSANSANNTKGTDALGKDDFLKLLVTQLQYQDPMNPMENKDFIAQTAQFSALEQMQNINQNFNFFMRMQAVSNASSLIGREVTYLVPPAKEGDEPKQLSGIVTEITFADGTTYMKVNGEKVPLETLLTVTKPTPQPEISNVAALIGKKIKYLDPSPEKGKDPEELTGIVTEIVFDDGKTYLKVDDEKVPLNNLLSIINT